MELVNVGQVVDDLENRKPSIDVEVRVLRYVISDNVRAKIAAAMETFLVELGDIVQEDLIKSRIVTSE